jgi:hypothetical protein
MYGLRFLFCVYFTLLVFVPCSDAHALEFESSFVTAHTSAATCTHADNCSPFCTCACCGLVTAPPISSTMIILAEKILPIKEEVNFLHLLLYPSQYSTRLLRPPQA